MKPINTLCITSLFYLGSVVLAQDVHFDYDRSANFGSYKTYQWTDLPSGRTSNQLMDQNIKRAVEEQLAMKGLKRVEHGGDLRIKYQAATELEKQFEGFTMGPRWNGMGRVNSSTVEIGKLVVELYDPARKQLVWRGEAEKTLDLKKDPDKNYRNLQKAMAKLFQNYPPGTSKR